MVLAFCPTTKQFKARRFNLKLVSRAPASTRDEVIEALEQILRERRKAKECVSGQRAVSVAGLGEPRASLAEAERGGPAGVTGDAADAAARAARPGRVLRDVAAKPKAGRPEH
jgi:hypothetical protein